MSQGQDAPGEIVVRRVTTAGDSALAELSVLLHATFADPDTVLELDRMQAFLAQPDGATERRFCVVVAEDAGEVLGGTVFSYVPETNCGFSEYLVARRDRRGQGIGRLLVDTRRAILDEHARQAGHASCIGLFIEADSPERVPAELLARERESAMDAWDRLRLFDHLGFFRVDVTYTQMPLGIGKQPVTYLDLLFAPWDPHVRAEALIPAALVHRTLAPIWRSWAPSTYGPHLTSLQNQLGDSLVQLLPLV